LPLDTIRRFAARRPDPWRNGGGITREIASGDTVGKFAWRLSLADVEQPGAFSLFPDTERIITVVGGQGMVLDIEGQEHTVEPGRPFHFSGDAAVTASLPTGPVRALNIITNHDTVRAGVVLRELSDHRTHQVVPHSFAVLLSGHAFARTDVTTSELCIFDTVCGTEPDIPVITGSGLLAIVSLDHHA
jgi:uncharacterized protein